MSNSNSGSCTASQESSFPAAAAAASLQDGAESRRPFPFRKVVVTFPDARAAHAADTGPLQQLRDAYYYTATAGAASGQEQQQCKVDIMASTDPHGCRVGSGGGTLAALVDAKKECTSTNDTDDEGSILILHAGGASSRCPTQMVLGKAWTAFPCQSGVLSNPIHICLELCQRLFQGLPCGSIVVACSDIILLLLLNSNNDAIAVDDSIPPPVVTDNASHIPCWPEHASSSVFVLAVPTALATAQNHGVFVLDKKEEQEEEQDELQVRTTSTTRRNCVFPCREIYQKPDLETLTRHCAFSLSTSGDNVDTNIATVNNRSNNKNSSSNRLIILQEQVAWTDTGIVVFLPMAAKALSHLAVNTELTACTSPGLEKLWQREQQQGQSTSTNTTTPTSRTIQEFAAHVAPSIDLYTDFLYALSRRADGELSAAASASSTSNEKGTDGNDNNTLARYRQRLPNLSASMAATIHETLSPMQLKIWTMPQGRMLHLGTTRELMDYYILGSAAPTTAAASANDDGASEPAAAAANGCAEHDDNDVGLWIENPGLTENEKEEDQSYRGATKQQQHHRSFLCRESGRQLGFVRRLDCMVAQLGNGGTAVTTSGSNNASFQISSSTVIFNSLLQAQGNLVIDKECVLEHNLFQTNGSICIGQDCLVSGLRGTAQDEQDGLELPNSIMVQKIALLQTSQTHGCENGEAFVYMVLGIDDPIKKGSIIYNQPLDDFIQWSGMSKDDLWETADGSNQVLWHAKIHPIVTQESYMSLFAWLIHFSKNTSVDNNDTARLSLDCWKSAPRLSLADIRETSNALTEFSFRTITIPQEMTRCKTSHLRKIEESLLGRKHEAIDLQFAVDSFAFGGGQLNDALLALHALDKVIAKSFADAMFDVCGRACMVSSTFLLELEKVTPGRTDEVETHPLDQRALESISGFPIIPHGHADSDLHVVGIICSSLLSKLRQPDQACTFDQIAILRDFLLKQAPDLAVLHLANLMESIAHFMTQKCVVGSRDLQALLHCKGSPVIDQWVLAAAPARIDLAGGWSDTPPICFEFGGAVTGIAVKIDNMKPLVCRSRIVLGCGGGILLRTEHRGYNCELRSAIQTEVRTYEDIYDFQDPTADCTLLKCALICLGFVNPSDVRGRSGSLQSTIDSFCGVPGGTVARLEIVSSSMVPHGSGLGTSSILGGCVLAAMGKCVGIPFGSDYLDLIRGVLILEQYLTTGGGWQDQINGLLGGAKIATCNPYVFPLDLSIEQLELDNALVRDLDTRLFLVFTGKTRLAKNLLGRALGRWSKRTPSIVGNLSNLVEGAKSASDALVAGDLDSLGTTLSSYWEQKKLMCGQESGVEPIIVSRLLNNLKESKMIRGGALCGAGGGGFLVLLLQENVTKADLAAVLNAVDGDMSLHKCTICKSGLKISVLSNMQDSSPQFLDPSWLSSESD